MKFKIEFLFDNGEVNKKVQLAKIIVTFEKALISSLFASRTAPFFEKLFYESWTWPKVEKVLTMRTIFIHHSLYIWDVFWLEI